MDTGAFLLATRFFCRLTLLRTTVSWFSQTIIQARS